MIQFDNVSKRYASGHVALENISFQLDVGEMAFLTGHSGAGKSTLMKLIALIERTSGGQIVINNKNLSRISRRGIAHHRRGIGVIFQNHKLLYDRTVFDNVALPLIVAGHHQHDIASRVRAALDKVGLLRHEKLYPITLSGGEQQRVGIARAVVHKPPVILADEPTGNLDPDLSKEIMKLFQQFNQVGVTMLIATHDLDLVKQMKQRVLTLEHGKLIYNSQVAEE